MKTITILLVVISLICMQATVLRTRTLEKAELGALLFSDKILSKDSTISCASCHRPEYGFADTSIVSIGVAGKKGNRNTPTAMNVSLGKFFFWDGRAKTLEEQALMPIENSEEMNLPMEDAVARLKTNKNYTAYFLKMFKSEPSRSGLGEALAAFERTLETSNSPFDNWKFTGDSNAVSTSVKNGFNLFNGKANCVKCHFGSDFTAHEFQNIGLFNGRNLNDSGRAVITGKKEDVGKFKTSSLRNVAITAPYMHNGMFRTLDDVIEFYDNSKRIVPDAINMDTLLQKPLRLTKAEKKDLKEFLLYLTDNRFRPLSSTRIALKP